MKLVPLLLALACAVSSRAGEPVFDPFAPATKSFEESLPPAPKSPGREIVVQVLAIRERGRIAPWPSEPPQEWQTQAEGLITLKTRLNVPAEAEQPALIEKDPAGKPLPDAVSIGSSFACRADETEEAGVYTLHFAYSYNIFTGWLEEPKNTYTPLREGRSYRSKIQLNNRWFLMGGGGSTRITNGVEEKTDAEALYFRIDDGLPPAARAAAIQEPSFVTPVR